MIGKAKVIARYYELTTGMFRSAPYYTDIFAQDEHSCYIAHTTSWSYIVMIDIVHVSDSLNTIDVYNMFSTSHSRRKTNTASVIRGLPSPSRVAILSVTFEVRHSFRNFCRSLLNLWQSSNRCFISSGHLHISHDGCGKWSITCLCVRRVCPIRILARTTSSLRIVRELDAQLPIFGLTSFSNVGRYSCQRFAKLTESGQNPS